MMTDPGRASREDEAQREIDAFFALPRQRLYLFGLLAIVQLAALMGIALLLARVGALAFIFPVGAAAAAATTALLCRTVAGRGCLRTIGLGWRSGARLAPTTQLWVWIVLTALASAVVLWATFS